MDNNEPLEEGDLKIDDLAEFRRENTKADRKGTLLPMHVSRLTLKLKGELSQNELEELYHTAPKCRGEKRVELEKQEIE